MARKAKPLPHDAGGDGSGVPIQAPAPAKARRKSPPRNKTGPAKRADQARDEIERQEKIAEALDYRRQGYSYAQIARTMEQAPSTVHGWVKQGLHAIIKDEAEDVKTMMIDKLDLMEQKIMELFLETPDPSYVSSLLTLQRQRLSLYGISLKTEAHDVGDAAGKAFAETFLASIKADKPMLKPDERIPASPVM